MSTPAKIVNSWNEWDPLREVVVGIADNACFEPTEPGHRPQVRNAPHTPFPTGPKPKTSIDRANEELTGFVNLLRSRGITVRRPEPHDFSAPIRTPAFEVENQYCCVCPRDVMITLGNEILEGTMSRRGRYFEYQVYRRLVYEYWDADPGMTWSVGPKPSMADEMYRQEFWGWPLEKRHREMHRFEFCINQDEVVFDAADMCRFGRDVLVQESMTTNRAGIRWLKRHLEPQGLRVHPVHFPLDFFPTHIDATFIPLRPGLVLTNPERPIREDEEKMFRANGWELVEAPPPISTNEEMPSYCQSSKWVSINILSLSPTQIVCEEREKPLQDLLARLDFEVFAIPFRNVYEYGGSLHCATWDIRREGFKEDYFPRLDYRPLG
jgi:glycine amidinotransferase